MPFPTFHHLSTNRSLAPKLLTSLMMGTGQWESTVTTDHGGQEASVSALDSQLVPSSELHHVTRNPFSLWHDASTSLIHSDSTFSDHRNRHRHDSAESFFQEKFSRNNHQSDAFVAAHSRSHQSDPTISGETSDGRSKNEEAVTQESEPSDPLELLAKLNPLLEHHPTGRIYREGAHHIHHLSSLSERIPHKSRDYEWR